MSRRTLRNSRTRTAAVGGALCVALLLAGCSNDGGDGDGGAIPGTEQGGDDTDPTAGEDDEEPQDEEPEDDGIDRPEIDLGDAYENVYADEYTGDPVKDAVLRDSEGFQDAVTEGMIHQRTDLPAIDFYIADEAKAATLKLLQRLIDQKLSSTGTVEYFNRQVTVFDDGVSAAVVFCRDTSRTDTINAETGEVIEDYESVDYPIIYTSRLELNELGVWQTVEYHGENGTGDC